MRPRIIPVTKVTNSGNSATITEATSGTNVSAKTRHNREFCEFKGVKPPMNIGRAMYVDLESIGHAIHGDKWEARLDAANKAVEAERPRARILGEGARTIRKGYTTQVVK